MDEGDHHVCNGSVQHALVSHACCGHFAQEHEYSGLVSVVSPQPQANVAKKGLCVRLVCGTGGAGAAGTHVVANGRPPQAQSSLGQGNTGFGSTMVSVFQGRSGSGGAAPFQAAPVVGRTAASFMPFMQHQGNCAHSDAAQMPLMQPQGLNDPRYQGQFPQRLPFVPSVAQFQLQPSQQSQGTHSTQLTPSLSNSQTLASQNSSGLAYSPPGSSSLT